jgi:hypothetical protein
MLEPFQADEEDVANPGKVFEPMDDQVMQTSDDCMGLHEKELERSFDVYKGC